jgi:hypothetical protein
MTDDDLKRKQLYLKILTKDIEQAKLKFHNTGELTPYLNLRKERTRILNQLRKYEEKTN